MFHQAEGAAFSLPARDAYASALAETRTRLGAADFAAAEAAGRALRLEQALAEADAFLASPAPAAAKSAIAPLSSGAGLTEREVDVLRLLVAGRSNPEIAAALFISSGTVRTHVSNILAKLDARSRTEAATLAHRLGLLG